MKTITRVWAALLIVSIPLTAWAQEVPAEPEPSGSRAFLSWAAGLVILVLGAAGTWMVTQIAKFFREKTGIEIPAALENEMFEWAARGVNLAEEKSRTALERLGREMESQEKLEVAIDFLHGVMKRHGIDKTVEGRLKDYIEAALGTQRANVPPELPPARVVS